MIKLPTWMRVTMLATALLNILGSVAFIPSARALREWGGLPAETHPLYLTTVGAFIFIFGCAYLWVAITGKADQLFVAVGAAGKLVFFGLLVGYSIAGLLPATAALSGAGDLVFGILFLKWLFSAPLKN